VQFFYYSLVEVANIKPDLLQAFTGNKQKGYAPIRALIENCIVPENFSLRPQPSPPEPTINHHCQTCIISQNITIHKIIIF